MQKTPELSANHFVRAFVEDYRSRKVRRVSRRYETRQRSNLSSTVVLCVLAVGQQQPVAVEIKWLNHEDWIVRQLQRRQFRTPSLFLAIWSGEFTKQVFAAAASSGVAKDPR